MGRKIALDIKQDKQGEVKEGNREGEERRGSRGRRKMIVITCKYEEKM